MERVAPGATAVLKISIGDTADTGYPLLVWAKDCTGKTLDSNHTMSATGEGTGIYSFSLSIPDFTPKGAGNAKIEVVIAGNIEYKYISFEVV